MKLRIDDDYDDFLRPRSSGTYPVGIVGEANYQGAIRRCSAGQPVHIVHELGNPFDNDALAVLTSGGETIGYIARDCWLQRAIHKEEHGCEATIKEVSSGGLGILGIVLDVTVSDSPVSTRQFTRPELRAKPASEPKGWFVRLLGL